MINKDINDYLRLAIMEEVNKRLGKNFECVNDLIDYAKKLKKENRLLKMQIRIMRTSLNSTYGVCRMNELKPLVVAKCKHRTSCYNYKIGDCSKCNVWNYLYDTNAVIEWCKKHNEDISMITLKLHKELETDE